MSQQEQNHEVLAVRFYRDQVITIAREEYQEEEVSYQPCDTLEQAMEELRHAAAAKNLDMEVETLQSNAAPLAVQRHNPTENKVVSAGGFNFGIAITRG